MKPLLQLVHLSDIHFRQMGGTPASLARFVSPRSAAWTAVFQGMEGHDPQVLDPLVESIRGEVRPSKDEFEHGTHLVVTGDLATLGDDPSALRAEKLVHDLASQTGIPAPYIVYGNHDVWPGSLPLHHLPATLDARRTALRARPIHGHDRPARVLGAGPFSLWYLNTVRHGPIENFFALGRIGSDHYWDPGRRLAPQLDLLAAAATRAELRIALTHHPIVQPQKLPWKGLRNWRDMERGFALSDPAGGRHRLIRIVLSGHTHAVYPSIGSLSASVAGRNARRVHVQLVVGTASQLRHGRPPSVMEPSLEQRQCWQLIRFYETPSGRLQLERIVFVRTDVRVRPGRTRPRYVPISPGGNANNVAESALL